MKRIVVGAVSALLMTLSGSVWSAPLTLEVPTLELGRIAMDEDATDGARLAGLDLSVAGTRGQAQSPDRASAGIREDGLIALGLSIFVGFGVGHFYYDVSGGVAFLIADLVSIGAIIAGGVLIVDSAQVADESLSTPGFVLAGGGAAVLMGARIWEIADIAIEVGRRRNKVAFAPALTPVTAANGALAGYTLGASTNF